MFHTAHKHALAIVVVAAAVLATTGSVYQHNQTDREFSQVSPHEPVAAIQDGTSNTIMF